MKLLVTTMLFVLILGCNRTKKEAVTTPNSQDINVSGVQLELSKWKSGKSVPALRFINHEPGQVHLYKVCKLESQDDCYRSFTIEDQAYLFDLEKGEYILKLRDCFFDPNGTDSNFSCQDKKNEFIRISSDPEFKDKAFGALVNSAEVYAVQTFNTSKTLINTLDQCLQTNPSLSFSEDEQNYYIAKQIRFA